eukprot:scaffold2027_cov52-Attheya_sp.AAC.2
MMDSKRKPTMTSLIIVLMTMVSSSPLIGVVGAIEESSEAAYGVDVSFPIHHFPEISNNYPWLPHNANPESNPVPDEYKDMALQPLGNKQEAYDNFLNGCVERYGEKGHICQSTEVERVAMALRQPQAMQNYTDVGFKKLRAPKALYKMVKDFWDKNKDTQSNENWPKGNTYTNHWVAPTYMVSVEDRALRGGGGQLKQKLWDEARGVLEEWTGEELEQCSLYGIRVYTEGAMLATHVDRMPLVSSAIINVAQDLDEPWPIEVYGHDGKATNVTMLPGDMVLYESHSVLHGRPFPLKGRFYANIFIHFEPTGHSLRHNAKMKNDNLNPDQRYKDAIARKTVGHEAANHDYDEDETMPSYIREGSTEAMKWKASHRNHNPSEKNMSQTGSTELHILAKEGDVKTLAEVVQKKTHLLNAQDENGWTPLHEASRGGHKEVVELLVKHGAELNLRTDEGFGGTALWTAIEEHGEDHPVVDFLQSVGALSIGPDL